MKGCCPDPPETCYSGGGCRHSSTNPLPVRSSGQRSEVSLDHSVPPREWSSKMMLLREVLTLPIREKVLVLHLRGEDSDPTGYIPHQLCREQITRRCAGAQRIHLHCCTAGSAQVEAWLREHPQTPHWVHVQGVRLFGRPAGGCTKGSQEPPPVGIRHPVPFIRGTSDQHTRLPRWGGPGSGQNPQGITRRSDRPCQCQCPAPVQFLECTGLHFWHSCPVITEAVKLTWYSV